MKKSSKQSPLSVEKFLSNFGESAPMWVCGVIKNTTDKRRKVLEVQTLAGVKFRFPVVVMPNVFIADYDKDAVIRLSQRATMAYNDDDGVNVEINLHIMEISYPKVVGDGRGVD